MIERLKLIERAANNVRLRNIAQQEQRKRNYRKVNATIVVIEEEDSDDKNYW